MKKYLFITLSLVYSVLMIYPMSSCSRKILDNSDFDSLLPEVNEPDPPVISETLKEKEGWAIDTMDNGLIHYQFDKYVQTQTANQFVNVVEVDLSNSQYELEFVSLADRDTLSAVAKDKSAIIGINGTYEADASFIKANGNISSPITLAEGHLRYWKHEGAISYNAGQDLTIGYGTKESYGQSPYLNIFSAAPMLIDDYKKVGEDFIGDVTGVDLNSLDYEDYRRHQGVRHPRTAVALTEDNKLLLITIDGRFQESAGMTAKEVTQFLGKYFEPQYALNLDGGGSTTMYVQDKGFKGVINYPTDNGARDHYGQRPLRTFILVKKTSNEEQFAGGDGTEANPYLIASANQLQNMHSLNWSNTESKPYYFKLTADINMSGRNWTPLNNVDPYMKFLHFDGNGHVIENLKVEEAGYGSLFGVLLGSCKNLGVVNADIQSTSGGGIIAGYVGLKGPNKPTGSIENCFTTGKVSGNDAVGGIAGNVGKPNGEELSKVINSFSTADVVATNSGGSNSRAGGLVGILWDGGILENGFATGEILSNTSSGRGAGGILGWADSDVSGLIAFNSVVKNVGEGFNGRISANMGQVGAVIAQGEHCWASEEVKVFKNDVEVPASQFNTGEIKEKNIPYDGETKSKSFLGDIDNYQNTLGWKMGPQNPWAYSLSSKGYPILQWLFLRGDYEDYF